MESVTLPGILDSLSAIGKYVADAAAEAGLDKKTMYRLRLAIDEITTNIIVHGYDEAGKHGEINISAEHDANALTIYIEDTGASYNPNQFTDMDEELKRPMEERKIGGLGVFLSIQSVDKFLYERVNGRNRHTFVMNVKKEGS